MSYHTVIPSPIELSETTSTNTFLSALCDKQPMPDMTCVFSAYQTAGRGQRGNSWESEPGANLLFSYVVYPDFLEAHRQFLLSQITALSVQEVLSGYTEGISIKWPNDIYWYDKKICGTLIENDLTGIYISRSISGTGVNLNQKEFKSDAPNPVSLTQITGQHYEPREILKQITERIAFYYGLLQAGDSLTIATRYKDKLYRKDGFHRYADSDGEFKARIVDIEPIGKLVLEDESGTVRKYMFKEVSFKL